MTHLTQKTDYSVHIVYEYLCFENDYSLFESMFFEVCAHILFFFFFFFFFFVNNTNTVAYRSLTL